jgi:hypothetical protein
MPSVHLDFVPPQIPDIVKLRIYESVAQTGPFNLIEEITNVGTYPTYLTRYTTDLANSVDNWFAIEWEDSKGYRTPISNSVKGNTVTALGELVQRVMLRDPNLNEEIVRQEAEAALAEYYGVTDVSTIDPSTVPPQIWTGLALYALVRSYLFADLTGASSGESYTAGLVSQKSDSSTAKRDLTAWLKEANKILGRDYSILMVMEELDYAGNTVVAIDQTRLIYEIE